MKGGIPDDCNAWTKTGIVECLGTPDEHTDTFYRHGDWGIEEHNEHEFEVYAIVEGKPILVKEGFTTFRECTEFIRGSIASKRLETDVDEKDPECQTPKEEVKMVIKPFRMMMEDIMKANGMTTDSDDDLDIDPSNVELYTRPENFRTEEIVRSRPFGDDGKSTDVFVAPRNPNRKGLNYGGSPSGMVGGEDVGYGYPSHVNKHPTKITDTVSRKPTNGPANPTRSMEGTSTSLDSTRTGVGINPDEKRRKEILGESALEPLPEGTEVEGFNYNVKEERPGIYPPRVEKENKYYGGEKPEFGGDKGLQAAQGYLVDALSNVLPEEILIAAMNDPSALQNVLKEQGPNGEVSKKLRGFLVNNPDFSDAWNKLSMGQKQVPGGRPGEGYHEEKAFVPYEVEGDQTYDFSNYTPESLIERLASSPLKKDDPIRKLIRNLMEEDENAYSSAYITTDYPSGKPFYSTRRYITENFDRVMDKLQKEGSAAINASRKASKNRQVRENPKLNSSGVFYTNVGRDSDNDAVQQSSDSDNPPENSIGEPGLKARKTLYPNQPWSHNADLTHEVRNLMDNLHWFTTSVYPNLKGGVTGQFYKVQNYGKDDNKTSATTWMTQEQAAQEAQNKFDRSKRGQALNEIYAMPHGDGATPEQIQAFNEALDAFYAAEHEKLSGKEAKAAATREKKKQEELDRHETNKLATEQRLQDKKDEEDELISEKNAVSEEYNRLIAEGGRSRAQHAADKKRKKKNGEPQTPHDAEYFADMYRTQYPRSNYKTMESLKELEAQLKADAENSRTKYTGKPGEIGQPRADRPTIQKKQNKMEVFKRGEESDDDLDDDRVPSFRDLVKAETDKVDATRGLPTGYRYKPETRVFRDLYRTTIIDGKDDISSVMPKAKD